MPALDRIAQGAPGVYTLAPEPVRRLTGVRLDACAFVGVAPRGPVRVPVLEAPLPAGEEWRLCDPVLKRRRTVAVKVDSFDAYRRLYGGFEGPGLLPYAVASFFEQGGREAWVLRIVHEHGSDALNAAAVAEGTLPGVIGAPLLRARSEGAWGNGLRATLGFTTRALPVPALPLSTTALRLGSGQDVSAGTLLRLRLTGGDHALRFVKEVQLVADPLLPRRWRSAVFDGATPADVIGAEIVEATLTLREMHEQGQGQVEEFAELGLHVLHPRWLAGVLCGESQLVWPDIAWAGAQLLPDGVLNLSQVHVGLPFSGGEDRYADIVHADFFDPDWGPTSDDPASGLQAVVDEDAITQLVLPDLYQPQPLPPQSEVGDRSLAGPAFAPCVELPEAVPTPPNTTALPGLALDPLDTADLETITGLLLDVQDFVETTRGHIALLDVPPGLQTQQALALRSRFDSAFCALYHPWLLASRHDEVRDDRDALIQLPPSAAAAGIVAASELQHGVPHGPANRVAQGVVKTLAAVSPGDHDRLHPQGVNVYLQEAAGVRLSAARTLSRDPQWRQLSVRRLLLMIRRTLLQQMQWAVFEPHTPALRRQIVQLCTAFLRRLYALGAFTGATEAEAFFVRCDESLNPAWRIDNGQLLAEIGVAPAEPMEFIVLQFTRSGDGTLTLETA
jgi:hypothetical protein